VVVVGWLVGKEVCGRGRAVITLYLSETEFRAYASSLSIVLHVTRDTSLCPLSAPLFHTPSLCLWPTQTLTPPVCSHPP